jgi:hypothetical protein
LGYANQCTRERQNPNFVPSATTCQGQLVAKAAPRACFERNRRAEMGDLGSLILKDKLRAIAPELK